MPLELSSWQVDITMVLLTLHWFENEVRSRCGALRTRSQDIGTRWLDGMDGMEDLEVFLSVCGVACLSLFTCFIAIIQLGFSIKQGLFPLPIAFILLLFRIEGTTQL